MESETLARMDRRVGGGQSSWTGFCTVVAIDSTRMWYNACAICERPLPEYKANEGIGQRPMCRFCNRNAFNPGLSGCRRLYRVLLTYWDAILTAFRACTVIHNSIAEATEFPQIFSNLTIYNSIHGLSVATEDRVKVVVCFDRAARVLFGCSADEFSNFCKINPSAAETACGILEGEIFRVTLNTPKNGNAEHLRVASVVPACSDFCPAITKMKNRHVVQPAFPERSAQCSSAYIDPGL